MRTQTSVDNTLNDLCHEIKFENCVKYKNNFFIIQNIAFLSWKKKSYSRRHIFKILKNLITSAFFADADTKNHRYTLAKASNAALVKLNDWITKNVNVINCAMFFSEWFKYGQASNVIWLSTAGLLIFCLEVANEKPLVTRKFAIVWIEISC